MPTTQYSIIALTALRIVAGFLFFQHGAQKLLGWFGGLDGAGGTATFPAQVWFAGVFELVGSILIALGLFTRPVAFLLSGQMAVAYFQVHAPQTFWPIQNGGELAALYCFLFLLFCTTGPGPYSLDRLLLKTR